MPGLAARASASGRGDTRSRPAWHALTLERLFGELSTTRQGLTDGDAARRLQEVGPNHIPSPRGVSALVILRDQLRSVVVVLLGIAIFLSLVIGDRVEAIAIGIVLVVNAALGFTTEWRARRAMEALLSLEAARALVWRAGRLAVVPAELLVPGDVVQLEAGNRIPADVRLIEASDLSIEEAALTGESMPAEKQIAPVAADAVVADRTNMAYLGTAVASGAGLGVVAATGGETELGRIGALVNQIKDEPTPLERRLDVLGRRLAWLTIGVAGVVSAIAAVNGEPWTSVLETGIALAVAAMPEALPAVATIALAVGMRRMALRHALIRRLPSVESLGSATVVCTDKTRTLTTGQMTVVKVWTAFEEIRRPEEAASVAWPAAAARVLDCAAAASRPPVTAGDPSHDTLANPVDLAILSSLGPADVRTSEFALPSKRGMLPFSSGRKLMATFHGDGTQLFTAVKGAPAAVLPRCDWMRTHEGRTAVDVGLRATLHEAQEKLARSGLRMLAVASGPVNDLSEAALRGLTFEGFVALADPVATGVQSTVALLRGAGLRTVMITGDQRATAEAVGRAIGLIHGPARIIEGRELAVMTSAQLAGRVAEVHAFSRVSPEHKLRIVEALQHRGEIVAMLGDGVNDAAALKKADVGVAMGRRGTDVAKQAAAVVLQDDRFETVAAAVEEGRVIFDNIRKFVFYLFSCNVAEVLVLLVAGLAGMPLPLTPLQLLWLNIVTDTFPALALAMEPGDATVMRRPPRDPQEAILAPAFVSSILWYGAMITAVTLASFASTLRSAPHHASTVAFMTLAVAQIAHLGTARSERDVLAPRRAFANRFALLGVGLATALQLLTTVAPLAQVIGVTALGRGEWLSVAVWGSVPALVGQLTKVVRAASPTGLRKIPRDA
jgi:P-type Ca2+ transporter type 2C